MVLTVINGTYFCKQNEIIYMVHANKIRINKYKSEYIKELVGVYIHQKCILTVDNISTKMGNVNGENLR